MENTAYAIFSEGDSTKFHLYSLDDLPQAERLLMQKSNDDFAEKVLPRWLAATKPKFLFQESINLEVISNNLQSSNFFENFHDGISFPFRGKGAMFVALVQTDDSNLFWILIRISLSYSQHIKEKAICDMLVEENIIIP